MKDIEELQEIVINHENQQSGSNTQKSHMKSIIMQTKG